MSWDMNKGYSGWSMSKRAAAAYDDGEMPKSKWTKRAMLAAIAECLDDNNLELTEQQASNLESMRKDDIFREFFEKTSWHHTSKFCNETDFYGVDEDTLVKAVNDELEFRFAVMATIATSEARESQTFDTFDEACTWLEERGFENAPRDGSEIRPAQDGRTAKISAFKWLV